MRNHLKLFSGMLAALILAGCDETPDIRNP
jgi:hypothetical protein